MRCNILLQCLSADCISTTTSPGAMHYVTSNAPQNEVTARVIDVGVFIQQYTRVCLYTIHSHSSSTALPGTVYHTADRHTALRDYDVPSGRGARRDSSAIQRSSSSSGRSIPIMTACSRILRVEIKEDSFGATGRPSCTQVASVETSSTY